MEIYAIILDEPNEEVWSKVEKHWKGRSYILNSRLAFVAPKEEITTTSNISETAGIGGENDVLGVVLQVSSYSGFSDIALWEWLRKVRK